MNLDNLLMLHIQLLDDQLYVRCVPPTNTVLSPICMWWHFKVTSCAPPDVLQIFWSPLQSLSVSNPCLRLLPSFSCSLFATILSNLQICMYTNLPEFCCKPFRASFCYLQGFNFKNNTYYCLILT